MGVDNKNFCNGVARLLTVSDGSFLCLQKEGDMLVVFLPVFPECFNTVLGARFYAMVAGRVGKGG